MVTHGAEGADKKENILRTPAAWAAVKIGMRRTGVPTKRSKSRQRSRIQGDGSGRRRRSRLRSRAFAEDLRQRQCARRHSDLIVQSAIKNKSIRGPSKSSCTSSLIPNRRSTIVPEAERVLTFGDTSRRKSKRRVAFPPPAFAMIN